MSVILHKPLKLEILCVGSTGMLASHRVRHSHAFRTHSVFAHTCSAPWELVEEPKACGVFLTEVHMEILCPTTPGLVCHAKGQLF